MSKRIPQSFIDDLLARTDIVELISQRLKLKKAGKNYQACCPFHNEKTPSFTVSPEKQFYHCFGCGAHGTALRFLMEYENLEFPDAVEELAQSYGLSVPYEQVSRYTPQGQGQTQAPEQNASALYALMQQVNRLYQFQLRQSPLAINYLKERGLDGETAKRFAIGYAPAGWDFLCRQFVSQHEQKSLEDLGLLIKKERDYYDRFRNRVMFPIRDRRGRVIGFGGRVFGDETPKYLNSPETTLFHKGRELYGLYELKEQHRHPARIVIVEGYMDVVALAQYGVDYAVASLGTSTTPDQVKLLYRQTEHVICCYDGDNAGREAAWRSLQNILPLLREGTGLSFCFLPDGQDPDSFVRSQGKAAFEAQLDTSMSFIDFMLERLHQDHQHADKTVQAAKAMELIAQMPEGLNQEQAITQLARLLRWGEGEARLKRLIQRRTKPQKQTESDLTTLKLTPLRRAIALVVQHPHIAAQMPAMPELQELDGNGFKLLDRLLAYVKQRPDLTTARLLEAWREHSYGAALMRLATLDLFAGDVHDELRDILLGFCDVCLQQRIEFLQAKSHHQTLTSEETQMLIRYLKILQN